MGTFYHRVALPVNVETRPRGSFVWRPRTRPPSDRREGPAVSQ